MEEPAKETEQAEESKTNPVLKTKSMTGQTEEGADLRSAEAGIEAPTTVKRKRGRPRKGTTIRKTPPPKPLGSISRQTKEKELGLSLQSESIEDPTEGETDSEVKPKRNRRSKILHDDYVADFNTSDEEEESEMLHRFTGRGRGRGKGLKSEFPEAFEDFFLSYNEVFGKELISGDESATGSIFGDLDDPGDHAQSLPDELPSQGSQGRRHEVGDMMEGVIGPDRQTQVQIISSGDTTVADGEESLIYNVIVTTGERKSITPIVIPKTTSDVASRGKNTMPPLSSSQTDTINEGEEIAKPITEEKSDKPSATSMQNKQHKNRYFSCPLSLIFVIY